MNHSFIRLHRVVIKTPQMFISLFSFFSYSWMRPWFALNDPIIFHISSMPSALSGVDFCNFDFQMETLMINFLALQLRKWTLNKPRTVPASEVNKLDFFGGEIMNRANNWKSLGWSKKEKLWISLYSIFIIVCSWVCIMNTNLNLMVVIHLVTVNLTFVKTI